jgi:hypothetical protein
VFYGIREDMRHQPKIDNGPVLQVFPLLPELLSSEDWVAVCVLHHGGHPADRRRAGAADKVFARVISGVHKVDVLVNHTR